METKKMLNAIEEKQPQLRSDFWTTILLKEPKEARGINMEGNIEKLHDILLRLGFKVLACPDNEEKPDVNVTMYGNKIGMIITVEGPLLRAYTNVKGNSVTGTTTSEEAAELLHEGLIKRDVV